MSKHNTLISKINRPAILLGIAVVLLGIMILVLQFSSSDTPQPSQAEKPIAPAGQVLGLSDAKTLLGLHAVVVPYDSGTANPLSTDDIKVDSISYTAKDPESKKTVQLTITVQSGKTDAVKKAYDDYKQSFNGTALAGVGDEAYYSENGKNVQVLKGNTWLSVTAGVTPSGSDKELEIKAATLLASKIN